MPSRFERIAGLYLLHTARLKCTWCYKLAGSDPAAAPYLVTPQELREFNRARGLQTAYNPQSRALIARRAVAHYRKMHPEVTLP